LCRPILQYTHLLVQIIQYNYEEVIALYTRCNSFAIIVV
jgi:hypothetical protein